jgi:3-hydroxybutyryl-CoA dehydratase
MPADQVTVGDALPARSFDVSAEAMKVFSVLMHDPNPIHYDHAFVRSLGLGDRPVNQGSITMGYLINAVLEWAGGPEHLERFQCRFHGSVLAGDTVTARGEVTAVEDGTATVELWLEGPDGARVLTGGARVRVGRSPS